jgi:hypothetical protein
MLTRRDLLLLLAGLLAVPASPAFAKKGNGGGNGGNGGGNDDDDDDDDDNGGGNGGGNDDDDDDDDDDNSGQGGGGGGGNDDDDDDDKDDDKGRKRDAKEARDAVKKGKAASLREVLGLVRGKYPGRVIDVDTSGTSNALIYSIKLIDQRNRRMQIRVNANQRRIIGAKFI